jgi:hypothetical protein
VRLWHSHKTRWVAQPQKHVLAGAASAAAEADTAAEAAVCTCRIAE